MIKFTSLLLVLSVCSTQVSAGPSSMTLNNSSVNSEFKLSFGSAKPPKAAAVLAFGSAKPPQAAAVLAFGSAKPPKVC